MTGPNRNLFVFTYDWRKSNFETARALRDFVTNTPGLANSDFDLLAHSMGGIVAIIYADRYDKPAEGENCSSIDRCRIKTVITAGTPYYGSMNAVATPEEGWGWLSRRIVGGKETIARTILSWPSFYELLPTYEDCCERYLGRSVADYEGFALLPYIANNSTLDQNAIRSALARRRDLDAIVRAGWPPHIASSSVQCTDRRLRSRLFIIAGDHHGTKQRMSTISGGLSYTERRGDGTVLLRSASMNDPGSAWISFEPHPTMLNDKNIRSKIEQILFRCDMATTDFSSPTPIISFERVTGGLVQKSVESISARIIQVDDLNGDRKFSFVGSLAVDGLHDVLPPEATLVGRVSGEEFLRRRLIAANVTRDGPNVRFAYEVGSLEAPRSGLVEAEIIFTDTVRARDQAIAF